jgi:uncharacterized protein
MKVLVGDSRANRERILILPEVAASTIRILTNPRIWSTPAPSRDVHRLFGQLMRTPDTSLAQAPLNTWRTFTQIVESLDLSGNDIPDAWLAASSHTLNATLVTRDVGFVKFPDLTVTYLSNNS